MRKKSAPAGIAWPSSGTSGMFSNAMRRSPPRAILMHATTGLLLVALAMAPAALAQTNPRPDSARPSGGASIKGSAAASAARRSPSSPGALLTRPAARLVRVEPGQNLYRIALAAGLPVDALMRVNGIENPDVLEAGRMLVIPEGGHPSAPSALAVVSAPRAAAPATSVASHTGKNSGSASAPAARTAPSALETSPPGPVPGSPLPGAPA